MSDDSQNPYATPSPYAGDHSGQDQRQPGLGYVRQIPILAIFTIVQGALLTLMALFCIGYGIFFAFLPGIVPEAERAQMQAESGAMFTIVSAALIGLGVFVLAVAILHIAYCRWHSRVKVPRPRLNYRHMAAGITRIHYDLLRTNKHRTCDLGFDRIPQPRRKNRLQNGRRWHEQERSRTSVLLKHERASTIMSTLTTGDDLQQLDR